MIGVPLRRLAHTANGAAFPHEHQGLDDGDLPFFKVSDFNLKGNERYLRTANNWVSMEAATSLRATAVPSGSILMPKVGAALLGNARRITTRSSVFDNNIAAVVPDAPDSRYFHYWLSTVDAAEFALPGPVPSLVPDVLLSLVVPIVTASEQRAISDFLDAETTRIDALITKKRRMITLLTERQRTLITDAVTGGPGTAGRGNGMMEWAVRPLRAYAEVRLGRQRSPANAEGPHMIRYLRAANVKDGTLDLTDVKTMNFSPEERELFSLRDGDVLITEGSGSLATVGASAVWRDDLPGLVCFQNTLLRLRPRSERTDGRFLAWWARHAFVDGLFASVSTGANIYHLSAARVRDLSMRFPPAAGQRAIADFLDTETARIDSLTTALARQIELLTERRQALITAAVTGELEVAGSIAEEAS